MSRKIDQEKMITSFETAIADIEKVKRAYLALMGLPLATQMVYERLLTDSIRNRLRFNRHPLPEVSLVSAIMKETGVTEELAFASYIHAAREDGSLIQTAEGGYCLSSATVDLLHDLTAAVKNARNQASTILMGVLVQ